MSETPEARAQALARELEAHYRAYRENAHARAEKGFFRLFQHWFSYDAQWAEPVHQAFLDGVSQLVSALAEALEALLRRNPEGSQSLALQAVQVMLEPKSRDAKSERDWYLLIAEYQCSPLLPYLSREDLQRFRDEMLERTPRRLMFPKQLALLEQTEALLRKD